MSGTLAAGLWLLVAAYLGLAALTVVGARRRGISWLFALVGGLFFPVTWTIWYLMDERPFDRGFGRQIAGR